MIGASWGGLEALSRLLDGVPDDLGLAFAVAQHRSPTATPGMLEELLQDHTPYIVCEAGDKDSIERGRIYVAPPDYHLLVEPGSFALSLEERVKYARPSIDVLFESAADAYGERVIGIVLTGSNEDGARGLTRIKDRGGVAIVQQPDTAQRRTMPEAALAATTTDAVLPLDEIGPFLYGLCVTPSHP